MRESLLIAWREMRERRVVLVAAAVAGLLPFASPLFPGVSAAQAGESREVIATVIAVGFGLVLSLMLGATAIGRDLVEHRLSFDFTRPVRGVSIWAGRLGAAVALTLAAMFAVVAPAALAGGRPTFPDWSDSHWLHFGVLGLCIALAGVGLAHVAGVAFRSRSPWLAVDLIGFVVVLLIVGSSIRRLQVAFAPQTAFAATVTILIATAAILWIASAVQVVSGRTDLGRGHRIQSIVLWSSLTILSSGLAAYSLWYVSADLSEIDIVEVQASPGGSWIALEGVAPNRSEVLHRFLLDTGSERSLHVGIVPHWLVGRLLFSADGRRAVLVQHETHIDGATQSVSVVDLDAASSVIRPTNISFRDAPRPAAISPSGRRLATFQAGSLAVHDIDSGQIVTATKLEVPDDSWWRVRLGFISDDRLRVYVLGERLAAHEYDVAARSVTSWSGPPLDDSYHELEWRADHTRLILQGRGSSGSTLIDGSQGLPILRLSDGGEPADSRPAFLADGRVVRFVHSLSGHARLELLSSDGVALQSYDLDGVERSNTLRLGAEVAPGTLSIVIDSRKCRLEDSARLLLVDLDSGRVREVPGGGRSLGRAFWRVDSSPEQPGSVASRLIYRDRSVWLLDPETLTVRLVAGPG